MVGDTHFTEDQTIGLVSCGVGGIDDVCDIFGVVSASPVGIQLGIGSPFDCERGPLQLSRVQNLVEVRCVSPPYNFFRVVDVEVHLVW